MTRRRLMLAALAAVLVVGLVHVSEEFRRGVPDAVGVGETWDGTIYRGASLNARAHGYGRLTWPDGRRYEGQFREGMPHGMGVMTYPAGRRIEGEFVDGDPVG